MEQYRQPIKEMAKPMIQPAAKGMRGIKYSEASSLFDLPSSINVFRGLPPLSASRLSMKPSDWLLSLEVNVSSGSRPSQISSTVARFLICYFKSLPGEVLWDLRSSTQPTRAVTSKIILVCDEIIIFFW